ncbi:hypothetical protein G6F37_006793 [Rhizopus arrhizus]|nr:hypothetical protein G6F38_002889 [Rhizopus arrhizus]KAG1157341.1 hypothetical protein G6F37_006793 [Rhizopus arrhizus]
MTDQESVSKYPKIDSMGLITADAGTGHGGITAVMKLTKMLIELAAMLIVTSTDACDHEFIVNTTNPNIKPLITVLLNVDQRDLTCAQIQAVDDDWTSQAGPQTV